jgi:putative transposase
MKLAKTEQLYQLSRECGRVYSKTVSYVRKVHKKKDFWLDEVQMCKIVKSDKLHSQTVQGVIKKYFVSLASYFKNVKSNPEARPPYKTHSHYCIPFKKSAIKIKDSEIILSCGMYNDPLVIPLPKGKELSDVGYAEITWDNGYYLSLVVESPKPDLVQGSKLVAVDPGEIHPLTVWNGEKGTIYNGRLLRSEKQHLNKVKAEFASKLSRKKKGSKRRKALARCKAKKLKRLNNRIKDAEHKITRHFVETCKADDVSTVVYGDTTHIRQDCDYGNKANQKIHQWAFDRIRFQVEYKLAEYGIKFMPQNERGTSHTCPRCGSHVNPNGRRFRCKVCGFECHRDIAGSMNILSKYLESEKIPVVAAMAPATGVRFNWHLRCSLSKVRIPRF